MEKFGCNTENTKSRLIGNLKEFIVNIIKFITVNVNLVVTKVILNSSIIEFARKVGTIALWNLFFLLMTLVQNFMLIKNIIIRNGKIVWKHGPYC